ncbi:MAG: hypothetical protein V1875_09205, partial [Candidatus Altiarchaeota archaeon]
HMHIFCTDDFKTVLREAGMEVMKVEGINLPDVSRNRFIVKPASSLVGAFLPGTRIDQIIFKLRKT